jgi:hypothetical protein
MEHVYRVRKIESTGEYEPQLLYVKDSNKGVLTCMTVGGAKEYELKIEDYKKCWYSEYNECDKECQRLNRSCA